MSTSYVKRPGENVKTVDCADFGREAAEQLRGPVAQLSALIVPIAAGHTVTRSVERLRKQLAAVSDAIARAQIILDGGDVNDDTGGS